MDKNKLVKDLIYLRGQIDNRIDNFITENALANREINLQDIEKLRNSIDYVMDERIGFMK